MKIVGVLKRLELESKVAEEVVEGVEGLKLEEEGRDVKV